MTNEGDPLELGLRQPGVTWWKHYWIVHAFPGDKRKATGASEGDRSHARPCRLDRDFDAADPRANVKRDGTGRTGVRSEASIRRHTRSPKDIEPAF